MDEDYDYNKIKDVGKASHAALKHTASLVKEGAKLLDVAEAGERFMKDKGFDAAFPINISINRIAAHYTPSSDDTRVFSAHDLVKIDLGARKETYLGDCAVTVDLSGNNQRFIKTSEEALDAAISMVRAGVELRNIGAEIEKIANKAGLKPIKNLGGHGIERTELHASVFIPNFDNGDDTKLEEGQVVAIEPFITDGAGYVGDSDVIEIFQRIGGAVQTPRSTEARAVLQFVDKNYMTYPFAIRWLQKGLELSEFRLRKALAELSSLELLEQFPVLVEEEGSLVSQSEKELIVEKDSCTVITA